MVSFLWLRLCRKFVLQNVGGSAWVQSQNDLDLVLGVGCMNLVTVISNSRYSRNLNFRTKGTSLDRRKAMERSWVFDPAPLALRHWTALLLVPLFLSLPEDRAVSAQVGEFDFACTQVYTPPSTEI